MRHDSSICDVTHFCATWLTHMWHDSLMCDMICDVTWLVRMWHGLLICSMTHYVTWLIDVWHDSLMCDMTHSYATWLINMWHDSLCDMARSYVTWPIHVCDTLTIIPYTTQTPWWCATRPIHMWHTTHSYMTWLICMWDMTHSCSWDTSDNSTYDSYAAIM